MRQASRAFEWWLEGPGGNLWQRKACSGAATHRARAEGEQKLGMGRWPMLPDLMLLHQLSNTQDCRFRVHREVSPKPHSLHCTFAEEYLNLSGAKALLLAAEWPSYPMGFSLQMELNFVSVYCKFKNWVAVAYRIFQPYLRITQVVKTCSHFTVSQLAKLSFHQFLVRALHRHDKSQSPEVKRTTSPVHTAAPNHLQKAWQNRACSITQKVNKLVPSDLHCFGVGDKSQDMRLLRLFLLYL